jgi:antitoxin component YwqK of YwqJK toxin-antitoxin module
MDLISHKISITLLVFIGFIGSGLSQSFKIHENDTINRVDANNKKQGKWIYFFKNNPSEIEKTGIYADNRKKGVWITYYSNGNLKSEITYKNNRPDGHAKIYYENGKLSEEGIWRGTKWVGAYNFYHENGNKAYEWNFAENGKRSGEQKYFYEDGNLRIKGDWINGKENGVITEYYEDGNVKSEKQFASGKFNANSSKFYAEKKVSVEDIPDDTNATVSQKHIESNNNENTYQAFNGNGYHKLYNAFRKIDREGEFRDGKLIDGERHYYNTEGKLIKTVVYKNGRVAEIIRK